MSGSFHHSKDDLLRRLKKIEGQVKGIQRMVSEEKYCVDVLVQIAAVRAAINRVGVILFEDHTRGCLKSALEQNKNQELKDDMIEELIDIIGKFTK